MPTYIYKREDGTTFEKMQGINADPLTECPDTGQKVKRVITGGAGVVYKGDGWYVKDYKDQGKPSAASNSSTSAKSETKSESASKASDKKTDSKAGEDS